MRLHALLSQRSLLALALVFLPAVATAQDDAETVRDLCSKVARLFRTRDFDQALPLAERAYALASESLGAAHPHTLTSLNNLANVYEMLGSYEEAAALHQSCVETRRRLLGDEHPDTLASLNDLAFQYESLGRGGSGKGPTGVHRQ